MHLNFYTAERDDAGGVYLYFTSPPQYFLPWCRKSYTEFPNALPSEADVMIWQITLSRSSRKRRLVITCNEEEVLNVVISGTTCTQTNEIGRLSHKKSGTWPDTWHNTWRVTWSDIWKRDVAKILFRFTGTSTYYCRPGIVRCAFYVPGIRNNTVVQLKICHT